MGTVFEALQHDLGRAVALKVLLPQYSDDIEFRRRFAREAQGLAGLDSPHVIQVYDYGELDGQLFMAMQLVRGADLHQRLAERGPLEPASALDIVAQIARGLGDVHDAGLLHRDVKPSNILIREHDGESHAYLCDFGIARAEHDDHTVTGGVAGTIGYMAPERHEGQPASVATDIYSLGCVLWMALTGSQPYAPASGVRLAMAHMTEPVPVYAGGGDMTDGINRVLARAMAKDPRERFQTAREMRHALLVGHGADQSALLPTSDGGAVPPATEVRSSSAQLTDPAGFALAVPHLEAPRDSGHGTTRVGRRRGAVMATAAVLAALSVGGVGYALTGRNGASPPRTEQAIDRPEQRASDVRTGAPATAQSSGQKQTRSRTRSTTESTPDPTPTASAEAPSVTAVATKTCWDGRTAMSREACGLPEGRDGMLTVFPSMAGCDEAPTRVQGKLEAYECFYGDFMIRYTRWQQGYDRYSYYDSENKVSASQWFVDDEFAGRQWISTEISAAESKPYQWSATYRYFPYSLSVEGTSPEARRKGISMIRAAVPRDIGLR